MKTITTTEELAEFCTYASGFDYVTVDTEFLRERTYYSMLCLVQLAVAGNGEDDAVLVDFNHPLADSLKAQRTRSRSAGFFYGGAQVSATTVRLF